MSTDYLAKTSALINSPRKEVWDALTKPEMISQYMFGTQVISDWKEGSPIIWKGEWHGKSYEDNGIILQLRPGELIQYSHFSPLSGVPDLPENYHIVTIELSDQRDQTQLVLTQDNNSSDSELQESEKNWGMMLSSLKVLLEKGR